MTVDPPQGDRHRRIRNVMQGAFSAAAIRQLPPVFSKIADKVRIRPFSMPLGGVSFYLIDGAQLGGSSLSVEDRGPAHRSV